MLMQSSLVKPSAISSKRLQEAPCFNSRLDGSSRFHTHSLQATCPHTIQQLRGAALVSGNAGGGTPRSACSTRAPPCLAAARSYGGLKRAAQKHGPPISVALKTLRFLQRCSLAPHTPLFPSAHRPYSNPPTKCVLSSRPAGNAFLNGCFSVAVDELLLETGYNASSLTLGGGVDISPPPSASDALEDQWQHIVG